MRVTTAFKRLLRLPGVNVTAVEFGTVTVTVTVALRRRRFRCPECPYSTRARYDERPVDSRWRHLDLGAWRLEVRARLRRLRCPRHGVRTEGVPFARPVEDSGFTHDFEHLVAWLATRMDKTAITRLTRITWRTVGRIIHRFRPGGASGGCLSEEWGLLLATSGDFSWPPAGTSSGHQRDFRVATDTQRMQRPSRWRLTTLR